MQFILIVLQNGAQRYRAKCLIGHRGRNAASRAALGRRCADVRSSSTPDEAGVPVRRSSSRDAAAPSASAPADTSAGNVTLPFHSIDWRLSRACEPPSILTVDERCCVFKDNCT